LVSLQVGSHSWKLSALVHSVVGLLLVVESAFTLTTDETISLELW